MQPNDNAKDVDTLLDKKPEQTEVIKPVNVVVVVEKSDSNESIICKSFYELIGTFMFMNCIYYCKGDVNKFVFGFWVILTFFGKLSGAHVNPAVSLGFYFYDGITLGSWGIGLFKLAMYVFMQFGGAALGVFVTKHFYSEVVYVGVPTDQSVAVVMLSEFIFTGTFVFVILFVCSKWTMPNEHPAIKCAVIVSWFFLIVNAGATLSGAAYNPAILTVLNVYAYRVKDDNAIRYLAYMITAELIGAILFTLIFHYCFENHYRLYHYKNEIRRNAVQAKICLVEADAIEADALV